MLENDCPPRSVETNPASVVVRETACKTILNHSPPGDYLSDDQASIEAMLQRAAELDVGTIWVDALNPRPRVWPAVSALLRQRFPELHQRYRKMLFDGTEREHYLAELRARVSRAAHRCGLADRVSGCM